MKTKIFLTTALAALLTFVGSASAQTAPAKDTSKAAATKTTKTTTPPPSAADIAAAKARGDVWVNTSTKVYHKSDNKYYGTTKAGKFMSEADAQKAGYKAAQDSPTKKSSGTTKK